MCRMPCPICWEGLYRDLRACPCGHVFHSICINTALMEKKRCPICRMKIQEEALLTLFWESKDEQEIQQKDKCMRCDTMLEQIKHMKINELNQAKKLRKTSNELGRMQEERLEFSKLLIQYLEKQNMSFTLSEGDKFAFLPLAWAFDILTEMDEHRIKIIEVMTTDKAAILEKYRSCRNSIRRLKDDIQTLENKVALLHKASTTRDKLLLRVLVEKNRLSEMNGKYWEEMQNLTTTIRDYDKEITLLTRKLNKLCWKAQKERRLRGDKFVEDLPMQRNTMATSHQQPRLRSVNCNGRERIGKCGSKIKHYFVQLKNAVKQKVFCCYD